MANVGSTTLSTPGSPGIGKSHAVVVGINYAQQNWRLRNAINDARKLADILTTEPHHYTVRSLYEEEATRQGVLSVVDSFNLCADDRLLFYFAGHGIAEDPDLNDEIEQVEGYLLPFDSTPQDPSTWLKMADIREKLAAFPCRHMLVILDCCFAGLIRGASTRDVGTPPRLYQERYKLYMRSRARQLLTSAGSSQKASDIAGSVLGQLGDRGDQGGHSPFARALFEGLSGKAEWRIAGQPSQGVITAQALGLYLRNIVEGWSYVTGRPQTPLLAPLTPEDVQDEGQYIFFLPGFDPQKLQSAPAFDLAHNPYRGFAPFTPEDATRGFFFTDPALVAKLEEHITRQPLTVVTGASGTGKSSLIYAGLVPRLRTRSGEKWEIPTPVLPGTAPIRALDNLKLMLDMQHPQSMTLGEKLAVWSQAHPGSKLLLVFDQLETLVTKCTNEQRARFLQELADALQAHRDHDFLHVALVMRSDCLPSITGEGTPLAALCPPANISTWRFHVPAVTPDLIKEAITGPAANSWLVLDPEDTLVKRLVADVGDLTGALPWLSYTLKQLYEKCWELNTPRVLTLDGYEALQYKSLKGVPALVCRQADRVAEELARAAKGAQADGLPGDPVADPLRRIMLRLVSLDSGERAPRRARLVEVDYEADEEMRAVVEKLVAARLVTIGRSSELGSYIEPAHPALVQQWEPVGGWLASAQEVLPLGLQAELSESGVEWVEAVPARPVGLLWTDNPYLPQVVQAQSRESPRFSRLENEFVQASSARKRHNQRVRRFLVTMLAVLTVLAIAAAGVAVAQRAEAIANFNRSEAQRLGGEASLLLTSSDDADAQLVALLSLRSLKREYTASGDTALQEATELPYPRLFKGHTGYDVLHLSISPDSRYMLTGSTDKTAVLWDVQSATQLFTLTGHLDQVTGTAFSPDGKYAITGSDDNTARLWDVSTGKEVRLFGGPPSALDGEKANEIFGGYRWARTSSVAFSPDGKHLLLAGVDRRLHLWDSETGQEIPRFADVNFDTSFFSSVDFSPDGKLVAVAGAGGKTWLLDMDSGEQFALFITESVAGAIFTSDGKYLLTSNWAQDGSRVRVWDVASKEELPSFTGHRDQIWAVAVSPDSRYVAQTSFERTIIWDLQGQSREQAQVLTSQKSSILSAAFSPDGKKLYTGGYEVIMEWDLDSQGMLPRFHQPSNSLGCAAISPDGRSALTSGLGDERVRLWDATVNPGRLVRTFDTTSYVNEIAFSPDGRYVAGGSKDTNSRLWDSATGQLVHTLAHTDTLGTHALFFLPGGKSLLTIGHSGVAQQWDVSNGSLLASVQLDGAQAGYYCHDSALSPGGEYIVTSNCCGPVSMWERQTGHEVRQFEGHSDAVRAVAFSPDGKQLATGSADRTARLWDVQTGSQLWQLNGHTDYVQAIAFSHDGRYVLTGSDDATARLWDTQTGGEVRRFATNGEPVRSVAFTPDDRYVLVGAGDGVARLWPVDPQEMVRYLCSEIFRDLTDPERRQYGIPETDPTCPKP
ncbi:MAG TPA: caspase family protein [Chloroflexia bacterium]|nr:caspase family protein [Chloroflexia bacterium]